MSECTCANPRCEDCGKRYVRKHCPSCAWLLCPICGKGCFDLCRRFNGFCECKFPENAEAVRLRMIADEAYKLYLADERQWRRAAEAAHEYQKYCRWMEIVPSKVQSVDVPDLEGYDRMRDDLIEMHNEEC